MMIYTVYILYSERFDKIYIGFTSNLIVRFHSHNQLGQKGWTIKYRPWEVIFCKYFYDKKSAMQFEKRLKSGRGREWIRHKINAQYKVSGFITDEEGNPKNISLLDEQLR